jgi:hypothetical protein
MRQDANALLTYVSGHMSANAAFVTLPDCTINVADESDSAWIRFSRVPVRGADFP